MMDTQRIISDNKIAICCPFHEEKTPSLVIDVRNNEYYCLSCGDNGTIPNDLDETKLHIQKLLVIVTTLINFKQGRHHV